MEITEKSIQCTQEEAKLIGVSLTLYRMENTNNQKLADEVTRIEDYISSANTAIYNLAEARLRFDSRRDPTYLEVNEMLQTLGERFISITRCVEVDSLVSSAVSNFAWNLLKPTYELIDTSESVINLASKMSVELMISLDSNLS